MEFLSLNVNTCFCDYALKGMSRITCSSFLRIASHHIHIDSYDQNILIRDRQPPKKLLLGIPPQGKIENSWTSEVRKYQDVQRNTEKYEKVPWRTKESASPRFLPCGVIWVPWKSSSMNVQILISTVSKFRCNFEMFWNYIGRPTILSRFRKFWNSIGIFPVAISARYFSVGIPSDFGKQSMSLPFYCPNSLGISTVFTWRTSGFTDHEFISPFFLRTVLGQFSTLELVHLCLYVIILAFLASSPISSLLAWLFHTSCLSFSVSGLSIIHHFVSIA